MYPTQNSTTYKNKKIKNKIDVIEENRPNLNSDNNKEQRKPK